MGQEVALSVIKPSSQGLIRIGHLFVATVVVASTHVPCTHTHTHQTRSRLEFETRGQKIPILIMVIKVYLATVVVDNYLISMHAW